MAREYTYVVIRHGSNAANQSLTPRAAVGLVTAPDRAEAHAAALAEFTCYNNQVIEVIPSSKAGREDYRVAWEAQQAHDEQAAELAAEWAELREAAAGARR